MVKINSLHPPLLLWLILKLSSVVWTMYEIINDSQSKKNSRFFFFLLGTSSGILENRPSNFYKNRFLEYESIQLWSCMEVVKSRERLRDSRHCLVDSTVRDCFSQSHFSNHKSKLEGSSSFKIFSYSLTSKPSVEILISEDWEKKTGLGYRVG